MASQPEVALDELELDMRTVAVIWADGNPQPDVTFAGCSAYEAIGLLRVAAQKLEYEYRLPTDEDELEDD